MSHLVTTLSAFLALVLGALPGPLAAQAAGDIPGVRINMETLRVQEKAEALFDQGNYKRAFFIYRNELVPIGDKYSQYMVGYMYLAGQGTEEDRVAATAWYRLAAERGTPEFVTARDQLMVSLRPEQIAESDRRFIELRKQYGDLALMMKAVRSDFEALQNRTGSRLASDANALTIIDMNRGGAIGSGAEYYRDIEDRLGSRLEFIARFADVDWDGTNVDAALLSEIEARLDARLDVLE